MHEKAVLTLQRDDRPSAVSLWLPLLLWMFVIFLLSTDMFAGDDTGSLLDLLLGWALSDESLEILNSVARKCAHMAEYAVLILLWYRALYITLIKWSLRIACLSLLLSVIYAASDEFHQTFTLSRTGSPWDVMIDSIGAVIGITCLRIYAGFRSEQK